MKWAAWSCCMELGIKLSVRLKYNKMHYCPNTFYKGLGLKCFRLFSDNFIEQNRTLPQKYNTINILAKPSVTPNVTAENEF